MTSLNAKVTPSTDQTDFKCNSNNTPQKLEKCTGWRVIVPNVEKVEVVEDTSDYPRR